MASNECDGQCGHAVIMTATVTVIMDVTVTTATATGASRRCSCCR